MLQFAKCGLYEQISNVLTRLTFSMAIQKKQLTKRRNIDKESFSKNFNKTGFNKVDL